MGKESMCERERLREREKTGEAERIRNWTETEEIRTIIIKKITFFMVFVKIWICVKFQILFFYSFFNFFLAFSFKLF